jgi:hypothetical protein
VITLPDSLITLTGMRTGIETRAEIRDGVDVMIADGVLQHLIDRGGADREDERGHAVGPRAEQFFTAIGGEMGRKRIVQDAIGASRFVGAACHSPERGIADEFE